MDKGALLNGALIGIALAFVLYVLSPTSPGESATSPSAVVASPAADSHTSEPPVSTSSSPTLQTPASPTTTPTVEPTRSSSATGPAAHPAADVQRWIQNPGKGTQPPAKTVFLTFDDGPADATAKILDILKAKGVKATFFVLGTSVERNPELLRRTHAEGHAIAVHSYSHDYKELYPGRTGKTSAIIADYNKALASIRKVLGQDFSSTAYRYPGGHQSWKGLSGADAALAAKGVYWIDWNAMTGDAEPVSRRPRTVSAAVEMAKRGISTGTKAIVVLAHDTSSDSVTVKALERIIDDYRAAGYTFGVIS